MGKTNDGRQGGLLHGDSHSAPSGGMPAVVVNQGNKPIIVEGGEVIINKNSVRKFWKELSRINQAGGGVPIKKPVGAVAKKGGIVGKGEQTLQTILFDKKVFTEKEAKAWLKKRNYSQQIEKGVSVWRARQKDPKKFDKKSFVSKPAGAGVTFVFAKLK